MRITGAFFWGGLIGGIFGVALFLFLITLCHLVVFFWTIFAWNGVCIVLVVLFAILGAFLNQDEANSKERYPDIYR